MLLLRERISDKIYRQCSDSIYFHWTEKRWWQEWRKNTCAMRKCLLDFIELSFVPILWISFWIKKHTVQPVIASKGLHQTTLKWIKQINKYNGKTKSKKRWAVTIPRIQGNCMQQSEWTHSLGLFFVGALLFQHCRQIAAAFLTFRLNFSAFKRKWKTRYLWIFNAFRLPNSTFYSCIVCNSCNLHILGCWSLFSSFFSFRSFRSSLFLFLFQIQLHLLGIHRIEGTFTANWINIHFESVTTLQ